jgi:hypothetical protein
LYAGSTTWPAGRAPEVLELAELAESRSPGLRAAPGTYPVPPGRGRWRVTLHARDFTGNASLAQTTMAVLPDAMTRVLTRAWNSSAQLDFAIDGRSEAAGLIAELQQDVVAWRWDDTANVDRPMFRGPITQTADNLTEETHVVNVTAHDHLAMLSRRLLTAAVTYTNADQDDMAADLVTRASAVSASSGTSLAPGSVLPLVLLLANPDGSTRSAKSGQLRSNTFNASTDLLTILDGEATLVNGFDYDVLPAGLTGSSDALRVFYPYQGVQRSDLALVYGSTVSALTRTIDSSTYGNYWRVIGNNSSGGNPATAQLFAETWNADANNVPTYPIGLWMSADNAPSIVTPAALTAQAQGDLSLHGTLIPVYTLTLTPGTYYYGAPFMGDVVPLVVQSGRLNVNTNVRVLGITYQIGDDGQEDVLLTVGQPGRTLVQLIQQSQHDLNALALR